MKSIQQSKEWQSPAYLLWLIRKQACGLRTYTQGLSDNEFDEMCKKDSFMRKNIQLELKDIQTIANQLLITIEPNSW